MSNNSYRRTVVSYIGYRPSFKSQKSRVAIIEYQVEHWEEAMTMLFATNAWQKLKREVGDELEISIINFVFAHEQ